MRSLLAAFLACTAITPADAAVITAADLAKNLRSTRPAARW
jgi:hypothetical protein